MNNKNELTKINEYGLGICSKCGRYEYLNQMPGKYQGLCYSCFVGELTQRKGFFLSPKGGIKVIK